MDEATRHVGDGGGEAIFDRVICAGIVDRSVIIRNRRDLLCFWEESFSLLLENIKELFFASGKRHS